MKGVGPRLADSLARLRIDTVEQLLLHLPVRYEDRTRVTPIGDLRPGDTAVVVANVVGTEISSRRRQTLISVLQDSTGSLTLRYFHFGAGHVGMLNRGARVRCFGEVRQGPTTLEMVHPECRVQEGDDSNALDQHLTPVYPTTRGVHQKTLRGLALQALKYLDRGTGENGLLSEYLPDAVLRQLGFPTMREALRLMHRPPPGDAANALFCQCHPALRRLAFDELLAHRLSLGRLRLKLKRNSAPVIITDGVLVSRFVDALSFRLTDAQRRVCAEIDRDLARPSPMARLLQGDVGSGKTVVAAMATLKAVEAGYQVALMAPTELLAEQHFQTFAAWLESLEVPMAWLSGRVKGTARCTMLEQIRMGVAKVVVGTHALFQDDVEFAQLALVIVDEQHRFGVHQRLALRNKGRRGIRCPHQLVMTATPIPRTLAMSAYADLDSSIIDELPRGRTPVATVVVSDDRRDEVIDRVRLACRAGRQTFWVCPLIDESEALRCEAASVTAANLAAALPDANIALAHGRQKPGEKNRVMAGFQAGHVDLLVATTVVEVGVDVPAASLMIVENAERLGLAQLHQLRGRVGRGGTASHCVLMYRRPLSARARARLTALRETSDGFEIARRDLELRGPGEVLGTRQTGAMQFRVADLLRDQDLLTDVQWVAEYLLREHPGSVEPIIRSWIGSAGRYGDV